MIPIPPNKNGGYKLVKYCRGCKTRMVLDKGNPNNYCENCRKNFEKE